MPFAARRPLPAALAAWAALALGPAARAAQEAAAPEVVARAADAEVSLAELRAWLQGLAAQEQAALARDPALLSQAVRSQLARRLVAKAAQAKGWDQRPEVRAHLARVREEALAELYLRSVAQPPEGYPGQAEIQAAYDANPAAFDAPAQYRVAQLFIAARSGDAAAEEKGRVRLEAVLARLREEGADFAAVAREASDERDSAGRGGELGWLAEAQVVPGIRPALQGLAKGAVSAPVRLEEGWHLIKLLDLRPAARRPLAEVREALAAQLRAERAQANRKAYLAKLLEQSPPVVNELSLSGLLPKAR